MIERFSRSWALLKASFEVLKQDKELLVFPLCAAIATILIAASFFIPVWQTGLLARADVDQVAQTQLVIWGFLFYLSQYFIVFFFNTALVGAALIRLNGGDPTVADGLRIAREKFLPILGYAAIAATVGIILRAIEERVGLIGKIVVGMIGVAFTVATFLVVPLLVTRNIGPIDAIKESATLLKKTWGENIIVNGGLSLIFFVIYFVMAFVFITLLIGAGSISSAIGVGGVLVLAFFAFVTVALIQAALQGIYAAALFQYATAQQSSAGFDATALQSAFRTK
jgi:hypothetical protein